MMLRNLTPHDVDLIAGDRRVSVRSDRLDVPVTVVEEHDDLGHVSVDGVEVPLVTLRGVDVDGLPDPVPGVLLVVARVVAAARPDRDDLVVPVDLVRDDHGQVVGCRALGRCSPAGGEH